MPHSFDYRSQHREIEPLRHNDCTTFLALPSDPLPRDKSQATAGANLAIKILGDYFLQTGPPRHDYNSICRGNQSLLPTYDFQRPMVIWSDARPAQKKIKNLATGAYKYLPNRSTDLVNG